MKKTILLLLISLFSFQSYAQNPDLYRTWYVRFVLSSDLNDPYEVSEISPPIQPFITILEDLSFTGEGACNTFNGVYVYEYLGYDTLSALNNFNETNEDCDFQIHNSFETHFFGFIGEEFWYEITQENDGLTLAAGNMFMGYAIFKEFPLSVSDNNLSDITIYPNPVSNKLYITSENSVLNKITVFSATGKLILEQSNNQDQTIDVSTLEKGIYFIELLSEKGKTTKKFIKN